MCFGHIFRMDEVSEGEIIGNKLLFRHLQHCQYHSTVGTCSALRFLWRHNTWVDYCAERLGGYLQCLGAKPSIRYKCKRCECKFGSLYFGNRFCGWISFLHRRKWIHFGVKLPETGNFSLLQAHRRPLIAFLFKIERSNVKRGMDRLWLLRLFSFFGEEYLWVGDFLNHSKTSSSPLHTDEAFFGSRGY